MEKKSVSIYMSEKDISKIEILRDAFECSNNSELIRMLIQEKFSQYQKYHEIFQ